GRSRKAQDTDQAGARFQIDPHGLCHDQGIRSHASPAQRTGSPLVPAARHQGRGAPCGESFWHWALGADGGHGHAQPPFRSSRLIGAERQPTSDCRQSLQQSQAGGHPENLNPYVKGVIWALVQHGIGPAWAGINRASGKAQFIWLIDPVYADKNRTSRNMELLRATSQELGELLDHDPHFAHRFSRSPFYTGKSPEAYRWYCQHDRVIRLQDFLRQVRVMAGQSQHIKNKRQQFNSGRELINAVKTRREEAQAFKALADDVENEMSAELDQYDPELIDGVRVRWISQGVAARDE